MLNETGITGIGVDIEDISRFREIPFDENKHFYEKIFTKNEIEYCLKKNNPCQHFAVRFCAKEAFIKAMDQKIGDYRSIEVIFNENKPLIVWREIKAFLSMSHDKDKAISFVIVKSS